MKMLAFRNTIPAQSNQKNNETSGSGAPGVQTELAATTVENSIVSQEITQFHDVEQPRIALPVLPQETSSINQLDNTATIVDFLKRPVRIDQFEFDTTQHADITEAISAYTFKDPQPYLKRYSIPGDIFKYGNKLEKANNHHYFKADVHLKLVLNVNPFICGRFYLTYSPYENQVDKARRQIYNSRAGITAYPGVEIDIQIDNSVELVIPFASYKEAYNLMNIEDEDYVTVYLFGISKLKGKPESNVKIDVAVYAWFENIVINMPTIKDIPSLEHKSRKTREVVKYVDRVVERVVDDEYKKRIEKLKATQPTVYGYIMSTLGFNKTKEYKANMQMNVERFEMDPIMEVSEDVVDNEPMRLRQEVKYLQQFAQIFGNYVDMMNDGVDARDFRDVGFAFDLLNEFLSQTNQRRDDALNFIERYFSTFKERMVIKVVKEVVGRMEIQAEAAKTTQYGIVSDVASTVGGVADAVSGLPIVGEIAGTVKWVSDIVGNIANIFGWSRPNDAERVCNLVNMPGKFFSHTTAIDNSVVLGLSQDNELGSPKDVFPSEVDEMGLAYVCANPGVKEVVVWSKNDAIDKTLALMEVGIGPFSRYQSPEGTVECNSSPSFYEQESGIPSCSDYDPDFSPKQGDMIQLVGSKAPALLDTVPCEYVSQLFQYWRATICFKISVVKTAFHTGRLEIFFDPGKYLSKLNSDGWRNSVDLRAYDKLDTTNNYKYILDLTQDTEITIRIPFVSDKLMLSTISANNYSTKDTILPPNLDNIFNSMIGSLIIRPVTKLLCPNTVSDDVDIVIWKWAEDVEFAVPKEATQVNMTPYEFENTPIKCEPLDPTAEELRVWCGKQGQYGDTCIRNKGTLPKCKAQRVHREKREVDAEMQINLANKADGNSIDILQGANSGMNGISVLEKVAGEKLVSLRPLLRAFRYLGTVGVNSEGVVLGSLTRVDHHDYVSIISYLYRFFRGGYRYKFFADATAKNLQSSVTSSIVKDPERANPVHVGPSHKTYVNLNPVHEVSVPYYSQYRKLPVSGKESIHQLRFSGQTQDGNMLKHEIYRAGNDDFTYGWLMGSPQLYLGSSQAWSCWKVVTSTVDPE
jgi:hypothetical protein